MKKRNPSFKKSPLPVEWQVRPMSWGGARWQSRAETGDDVYDRTFPNVSDLEWYLADRYGWRFARKVLAALATSTGDPVGTVKRNPGKGKRALKKAGRAVKRGAGALLGAGADVLKAGAEALNPGETEYVLQVYMKGAGWLDFGVYIDKAEATKAAQHRTNKHGAHTRVIDGATEKVVAEFKGNPGGEHLPGLPRKAQREYEHILAGAKAEGRYKGRQKEVAARTARKQYGANMARRRNASDKVISKAVTTYHKRPIGKYLFSGGMEFWVDLYSGREVFNTLAEAKAAVDKEVAWYADYYKKQGIKIKPPRNAPPRRRRNPDTCPTCGRPADQPYRRWDASGKITEGCIDDFHTGHLITPSASAFWHNRPQAKKWRAAMKKKMREMMKGAPRRRNSVEGIKQWEKAWGNYIKALKDLDKPIKGANARAARMRLGKAEKALQKLDPDFYKRVIMGRRNPSEKTGLRIVYLPANQAWALMWFDHILHIGSKADMQYEKRLLERGASSNPRRRNLGHKDADHPVEVTHHYRAGPPGYMTPWQRAHHAGQKQLFETGIKPAKRRNALTRAKMPTWVKNAIRRAKREGVDQAVAWETMYISKAQRDAFDQYLVKIGHPSAYEAGSQEYRIKRFVRERMGRRNPRKGTRRAGGRASSAARHKKELQAERLIDRYRAGLTDNHAAYQGAVDFLKGRRKSLNPTRKGMRKGYGQAKRVARESTTHAKSYRRGVEHELRKSARGGRRIGNPSAAEIRKDFAGRVGRGRDLYFPQGTPPGQLAKLGKLVLIDTDAGKIAPVAGQAWLCADTRGKLHIGTTKPAPLFDGPARNLGAVRKIEYEESKPHLGYPNPIVWYHHAGEETGKRPRLYADGRGGLAFKGGAYRITTRGIEN